MTDCKCVMNRGGTSSALQETSSSPFYLNAFQSDFLRSQAATQVSERKMPKIIINDTSRLIELTLLSLSEPFLEVI